MGTPLRSGPIALIAIVFLSCVLSSAAVVSAAPPAVGFPSITKVEPPSWWAKHTINPVRILVRGKNLSGASVQSVQSAIQISGTLVNRDGTYLFVNLGISPTAQPGSYSLKLKTPGGEATISFRIEPAPDPKKNFQGITTTDVIYLIMLDRFADGDQTNDKPGDAPDAANDRKNPRGFHGGDLRGVIDHLPYLKDLGVTALWLTPWYDNWNGLSACDKPWCPHTYYHGYHAIDYYAVEDRFGDMATLRELVARAHVLGMKIIQDQVANHVGSRHPWVEDPPLADWFHGTLENHILNRFKNSALLSPHANPEEVRNTLDGWFSDDLPDMNQEQPEVAHYEIQNALWWVGTTGIDGIRQDTAQYLPRAFLRSLSEALHRQYPRIWMVGEVFELDAAQTAFFIGGHTGWDGIDSGLDSVFDFSLWNASWQVFTDKLPARALRDQLKYDALYPDPLKLTTLVNNHDTPRFMSLPGASLEGAMMHTAFTLSTRGIPQLYYGEEIALEGRDDPDNRRDFPGGFPGDARNAFKAQDRTPNEQRMYEWTHAWLRLRAEHSAIRHGRLIDLLYDTDAYVFARQDRNETVIIAINRAAQEGKITIPADAVGITNGSTLSPFLGASGSGRVVNGGVTLVLPARTVAAYGVR